MIELSEIPWAIHEPALRTIVEISERRSPDPELLAQWKGHAGASDPDLAALALRGGSRLEGTGSVTLRDGVAVLPVVGPIFRHANLMTDISGATSLSRLATDFAVAVASDQVSAIVLELNTPGGEITGLAEFAAAVRAATAVKPVVAFVDGLAASAGYWIAAAAGEIAVATSALLGSIGVVATYRDARQRDAKAGVTTHEVVSSQSPHKRSDVATDEGRARAQALVDRLAADFVAAVADYRGVSGQDVTGKFGAGALLVGADAVAAGMAERVSSLETEISRLATSHRKGNPMTGTPATGTPAAAGTAATLSAAELAQQYPEAVAALREEARLSGLAAGLAEGKAAGAESERARILGIEAQTLAGHEALIAKFKADGSTTPEQAAVQVLAAEKAKHTAQLSLRRSDETATPPVGPGALVGQTATGAANDPLRDDGRPLETRAQASWDANADLRREFGAFGGYLAFLKTQIGR